jgi:predicted metal-binding membrane protein
LIAGAAIAAAGIYQLTPLKRVCLRHCRSPLHYVMGGWRSGRFGAVKMGLEHGAFCVGCCWGLMLILLALGVMSLTWMLVVAGLIFTEKVMPHGDRLARVFAIAFVGLGIWVAAAPGSVPGLTQPSSAAVMSMHMSGGSSMHRSARQQMNNAAASKHLRSTMPSMH